MSDHVGTLGVASFFPPGPLARFLQRQKYRRSRQDSNLRGQSPVDFWSTPLTAWVRLLPSVKSGDAGYRSLYLSHAERALYHLSYTPHD